MAVTRLAVDIGGTFTDVVLDSGGRRLTRKVLTTPSRPEQAVLDGTRLILHDAGLGFADIAVFIHAPPWRPMPSCNAAARAPRCWRRRASATCSRSAPKAATTNTT